MVPKVMIILGSSSDIAVAEKCMDIFEKLEIPYSLKIASAHRTPKQLVSFLEEIENDTDVIIGAAGKAAHLPGVIASHTLIPVIGLPIKSSTMDGLDSLLSIVQMPSGIPVATVAINGSKNASYLALQIIANKHECIKEKLILERKRNSEDVLKANLELMSKY